MAAALVGGAALGAAFGEFLKAVIDASKKAAMFKSVLGRLESTLSNLSPVIKEIESYNRVLDRPAKETAELIEIIKEGCKLIERCSKSKKWNWFKKFWYTYKLQDLEQSLLRFCQVDMQAQQTRDDKETLAVVKDTNMVIRRFISNYERRGGAVLGDQAPFPGSCRVPDPPLNIVGLDVPLKELKMEVFKDGASVIVVSAPGGCGKTTFVEKLCQDEEVKGKFKDNIFFVTISKKAPTLEIITQKLFQHKGYEMPKLENPIHSLENLLKQMEPSPILLILDDVWSGSESLVDKFRFKLSDYKILVTSRSVFPRFDSTYHLSPLKDNYAMALFCHSAFLQSGSSSIPNNLVKEIVERCNGFPLALKLIGSSLCGQPMAIWKDTLKNLSKGSSIFDFSLDLLTCLQSSLDSLDDMVKMKECYLDLGLFPEDQRIPATALIDMWVELHGIDDNYAIVILHKLHARNLINLVTKRKDANEDDGYYNEYFVMQHDLLRELTIYQSSLTPIEQRERLIIELSGNNFPEWWLEEKHQPLGAGVLSISTDEKFSSNWCNMDVPEVEVLVLNFQTENYNLPMFIEKMDKLKVLMVTNYGFYPAELNNFSILLSLSSLRRIRLEKVSIPALSMSTIQLRNLQKISMGMCKIGQACENYPNNKKTVDMFPNLLEIDIDCCDDLVEFPDGFCDIVRLRKLSITNCHKLSRLPNEIGKLVNLEELRLNSCTDLTALPDTIGNLSKLNILDISDCLSIEKLPRQIGELQGLKKLYMVGCSGCKLPPTIMNFQNLEAVICDEETANLWEPFKLHLNLTVIVQKEEINLNWLHTRYF